MIRINVRLNKKNHQALLLICIISLLPFSKIFSGELKTNSPDSTKYSIALNAGINEIRMRDDYITPFIMSSPIFATCLEINASSEETIHKAVISFNSGSLSSTGTGLDIRLKGGSLSYQYLKKIKETFFLSSPLSIYMGGGISSFAMNTDFTTKSIYGNNFDQTWYWSHSLDLCLYANYKISENQFLLLDLTLPFFKIISRPENGHYLSPANLNVIDNFLNAAKNGKSKFLWDAPAMGLRTEYKIKINDKTFFNCLYAFSFHASDDPLTLREYGNELLIGLDFIF